MGLIFIPGETTGDAIDDLIPDRIYTKNKLLEYLESSREKCRLMITGLTAEKLAERFIEEQGNKNFAVLEILLFNMRHVQYHAAQLNLLLRQEITNATNWVSLVKDDL